MDSETLGEYTLIGTGIGLIIIGLIRPTLPFLGHYPPPSAVVLVFLVVFGILLVLMGFGMRRMNTLDNQ